jgi:cell division protein FtsL
MKIGHIILLFFFVLTIPLSLGLVVWQSNRYEALEAKVDELEKTQERWIEDNKRLIAGIAIYSSAENIEKQAAEMGLVKIKPEDIIRILVKNDEQ